MEKRRNHESGERDSLASLGFGDSLIQEMPWYIDAIQGEFIALEGHHHILYIEEEIETFIVDPKLTYGNPVQVRLKGGNTIPQVLFNEKTTLIAEVVGDGIFQPLIWLPSIEMERIIIGWLVRQVIVSVNLKMIKVVHELGRQIHENLLTIYGYFGSKSNKETVAPDQGAHYIYSFVLKLAIRKKELDQKTLRAGLAEIRKCLPNIRDPQTRERVVNRLVILENALDKKSYFEGTYLLPILSDKHDPNQDDGAYSGLPYLDKGISKTVLDLLEKIEGYNEDVKEVGDEMGELADGRNSDFPESDGPKVDDLNENLDDVETGYEEKLDEFGRHQQANEQGLKAEIARKCNNGNGLEMILRRLTIEIKTLIDRNKFFLKIIKRILLPKEKDFIRKTRSRIQVIETLMTKQINLITRITEQEEVILEGGLNPELHAAKFNLLVRLRATMEQQWSELLFEQNHIEYDPEEGEVPEYLKEFLKLKEFEIVRMETFLEDCDDYFEETDAQLDSFPN